MAATWRVVTQRSQEQLTADGRFEPVKIVTFEVLPEGITSSVTVSDRLYSADYVRGLIEPIVDRMKAVHALEG